MTESLFIEVFSKLNGGDSYKQLKKEILNDIAQYKKVLVTNDDVVCYEDYYVKIVFRVAICSYKNFSITETEKLLNIYDKPKLITEEFISDILTIHSEAIRKIKESLEKN